MYVCLFYDDHRSNNLNTHAQWGRGCFFHLGSPKYTTLSRQRKFFAPQDWEFKLTDLSLVTWLQSRWEEGGRAFHTPLKFRLANKRILVSYEWHCFDEALPLLFEDLVKRPWPDKQRNKNYLCDKSLVVPLIFDGFIKTKSLHATITEAVIENFISFSLNLWFIHMQITYDYFSIRFNFISTTESF